MFFVSMDPVTRTPLPAPREGRVRQFDGYSGEFIAEFESVEAASASTGASLTGVRRVLAGFQHKAAGYRWTDVDAPPPLPSKRPCPPRRLEMDASGADVPPTPTPTPTTTEVYLAAPLAPPLAPPLRPPPPSFDDLLSVICALEPFHEAAVHLTEIRSILGAHGVDPAEIRGVTLRYFLATPDAQRKLWVLLRTAHETDEWAMVRATAMLVSAISDSPAT